MQNSTYFEVKITADGKLAYFDIHKYIKFLKQNMNGKWRGIVYFSRTNNKDLSTGMLKMWSWWMRILSDQTGMTQNEIESTLIEQFAPREYEVVQGKIQRKDFTLDGMRYEEFCHLCHRVHEYVTQEWDMDPEDLPFPKNMSA